MIKKYTLDDLVEEFLSSKANLLVQLRKGSISKEEFLAKARSFLESLDEVCEEEIDELMSQFESYIFGYSILSALIDDKEITDIRVLSFDNIRIKRNGKREGTNVKFSSPKEYRRFIDTIATKNQVNISNLNAIQRFTDIESHSDAILRFTLSMPIVNTVAEPYLCIRKVPKNFALMSDLVKLDMMDLETARMLVLRFNEGSTLICGGNSSGKTTLLNALKESIPNNKAVLVTQQADELTTMYHPDMMFLHSLPTVSESAVNYDLREISIAGLTMDVDYFLIGEIKGGEAMYLLNAAYTGQICAATIHSPSAMKGPDKLVDYCMYESRYSKEELMKMMDCFKTVIFMRDFKVAEVYAIKGYNELAKGLEYERLL